MSAPDEALILRRIIVEAIAATGGVASPEASIAFLSYLPAEIKAALAKERAAREQAEARAKELEDAWGSRAGKMRAEVESHKQTADQIAKVMILAADERMQRAERALSTARGEADFNSTWAEQAERALSEERAHANRLAEGLERVRVGLERMRVGCNLGTAWPMVDELLAAHAARRGG